MNNREWLYGMEPSELAAWFDAEHVEPNDGIKPESVVRADSVDANDSREKLEADVRKHYAYSTTTLMYPPSANKTTDMLSALPVDTVIGWLDRQAAITEEQTRYKWVTASAYEIAELKMNLNRANGAFETARRALEEQIAELERERDDLKAQIDEILAGDKATDAINAELAAKVKDLENQVERCDAEREHYRNLNSELMGVFDEARHVVARHEKDEGLA